MHDNVLHILNDKNVEVGDSVVNSYVRQKPTSDIGSVTLSNLRGKPTSWTQYQTAPKKTLLSADDLFLIKNRCSLSTRNTLNLSSTLRALDVAIAPNFDRELTKQNKRLEKYFQVTYLPFDMNGDDKTQPNITLKPVVYCNNVPELVELVCKERKIRKKELLLKIGIDGGGGFLKITLSMVQKEADECSTTREKGFKSTGVKKLLLLAIVPGVPEKYANIEQIWTSLLELDRIDAVISGDLKIINLLLGIMGHSSSYPCPYCFAPKSFLSDRCATSRTLTNIQHYSEKWLRDGAKEKHAKKFFNCVKKPLLGGSSTDDVIKLCPPPVLHITLGIVNAIYKSAERIDAEVAEQWVKVSNSTRHSQYGFTGRNCHKLIEHRSTLGADGPLGLLQKVAML